MKTYRLGSAPMIHTPGMLRWAINGYHFEADRKYLSDIFVEGWGLPAPAVHALLSGAVPYTVEDETVVFEVEEEGVAA